MSFVKIKIKNQPVLLPELEEFGISLFMKREDQIHPFISGNKYRKLKYNILKAKEQQKKNLLTFGGAFSNHISAVAFAGKEYGFKTIGIIRGDELGNDLEKTLQHNITLSTANDHEMQFKFVTRNDYRLKQTSKFIADLHKEFGDFYLVPEGGTNELAIKGCEEILKPEDKEFDVICCGIGTGGTISGLINSAKAHQKVLGFPALKGDFLQKEIEQYTIQNKNWSLINDYHFGGFAKTNEELINFINDFKQKTTIPLDPIYTGKMMFGIVDLIKNGYFKKGTKILAIHTGGLQGIQGMNEKLNRKKSPLIQ
ncbi:MAG: pyridoxal-phosphate dependent enzyme [Flavobacteriaceae bacterium]|nr:pyridoxal-phosphate dependent enzyme [Flavobacteriaceae bacterium]